MKEKERFIDVELINLPTELEYIAFSIARVDEKGTCKNLDDVWCLK